MCIHIYIEREREREREGDSARPFQMPCMRVYMHTCNRRSVKLAAPRKGNPKRGIRTKGSFSDLNVT